MVVVTINLSSRGSSVTRFGAYRSQAMSGISSDEAATIIHNGKNGVFLTVSEHANLINCQIYTKGQVPCARITEWE